MKTFMKLLLSLLLLSSSLQAEEDNRWIEIGEGTFEYGFIFPYKIKFFVPIGNRNIRDIKKGLVPMKFDLDWLIIDYSKKDVKKLFYTQLSENYPTKEGLYLSKNIINYFLRKLPTVQKHDNWTFVYFPDMGTKLYINDKKIHHLVGSELNRALVQSWINQSPVLTANLFSRLLKLQ